MVHTVTKIFKFLLPNYFKNKQKYILCILNKTWADASAFAFKARCSKEREDKISINHAEIKISKIEVSQYPKYAIKH